MKLMDDYKVEHYSRPSHRILLATGAVFVAGTTILNLSFSFLPMTMTQFFQNLMT